MLSAHIPPTNFLRPPIGHHSAAAAPHGPCDPPPDGLDTPIVVQPRLHLTVGFVALVPSPTDGVAMNSVTARKHET